MARVLVAGIAVLDFVYQVENLPDAAEKYRAQDMEIVGGGCGANAAVAIQRLGGEAELIARMADDQVGGLVGAELAGEGVCLSRLEISEGGRSSASAIYVDRNGERQIMNFRGRGLAPRPETIITADVQAVLVDTRWVEAADEVFRFGKMNGLPCVLDGEAPVEPHLAEAATHAVFSEQGIRALTGEASSEAALIRAAGDLPGWVAVTCGAKGVIWFEDGAVRREPGFAVEVVDTLGAGDVWHGAFALGLAEGMNEEAAVRFASAAAALKCTAFGGRKATPTRDEVEIFLKETV